MKSFVLASIAPIIWNTKTLLLLLLLLLYVCAFSSIFYESLFSRHYAGFHIISSITMNLKEKNLNQMVTGNCFHYAKQE